VVGLDTLAHVIKTMQDTLPHDPWHKYYAAPVWLSALISKGALGQKTRCGIFKKDGKTIKVLDLALAGLPRLGWRSACRRAGHPEEQEPGREVRPVACFQHPQAQFLWAIFRDIFHYVALHLEGIAHNARDVDFAMRWGFGWSQGPFETWQAAGWKAIAEAVRDDIAPARQ
jgi:3-hydroxyacyl-CoA dehydrogenase